jgi:formylglycine-generating enzyme required for sulfatase activity
VVPRQQQGRPRPVGTREANAFGLHDMLGSVWEYCSDRFAIGYGDGARAVDPVGPQQGTGHVLRGGSWFSAPGPTPSLRSQEEQDPAVRRNAFTGFRPARSPE